MRQKSKIIGFITTYNCAKMIKETFLNLPKEIFDQIIVVDDGSKDQPDLIVKKLGIPFFTHPHGGYGANIKYALAKAGKLGADYMIEIHGDGQYDPSTIPRAVKKAKQENYDLLLGSRFTRPKLALKDGMPLLRFLANLLMSFINRHLFQIPLSEFYNGFRIYSKKLVNQVKFEDTSDNYFYSFQIIIQARYHNLKIGEIPIRCDYHKEHTSESFWQASLHVFDTIKLLIIYIKARMGFKTALF